MKRFTARVALAVLLLTPFVTTAAPIMVGDTEWMQVKETQGFSWNNMSGVCDPDTGACSGALGSTDLSGWTWASMEQVDSLFSTFSSMAQSSNWITEFLTYFNPTYVDQGRNRLGIFGITRTVFDDGPIGTPDLYVIVGSVGAFLDDDYYWAHTGYTTRPASLSVFGTGTEYGGWFFRDAPVEVPEPSILTLLGLGLIGIRFACRHQQF